MNTKQDAPLSNNETGLVGRLPASTVERHAATARNIGEMWANGSTPQAVRQAILVELLKIEEFSQVRREVYAAIDGERDFQDAQWTNAVSVGEAILMMEDYLAEARSKWRREPAPELGSLDIVRKIAAVAVRCMEHNGVVSRL